MKRLFTALAIAAMMGLPASPVAAQADSTEVTFWQSVQDTRDPVELEAYLEAYPKGKFSVLARIRLKKLKASPQEVQKEQVVPVAKDTPKSAAKEAANVEPPVHECDRLAAHPVDPDKVSEGVAWADFVPDGAIKACRSALEKYPGTTRFQFQLGRAQHKAKSYTEALPLYRKAADKRHAGAQFAVAIFLYYAHGVKKDWALSAHWTRKAADQGHAMASFGLGNLYRDGHGVQKNVQEAVKWFRKAARDDIPNAMRALARLYYHGNGVAKNYGESLRWYKKAAAKGDTSATRTVGWMYENGKGTAKSGSEAIFWYRKAAELGDGLSMFNLGISYNSGQGVTQDYAQAASWYKKAVEKKTHEAYFNLAVLYNNGQGVAYDDRQAAQLMFLALKTGDEFAIDKMINESDSWRIGFRKQLQRLMKQEGAYSGTIDGRFGPATKRALRALVAKSEKSATQLTPARSVTPEALGIGDLKELGTLD